MSDRTNESVSAHSRTIEDLRRITGHSPRPLGTVPQREAAVAIAVLRGSRLVSEVATATGLCISEAHKALRGARKRGLVTWDDGKRGTIRSGLRVVR